MPNPYVGAPSSIADLCNLALGDIGWTRYITSMADQTPEATTAARVYPQAVGEVSRDIDWPGFTQHQLLTQIPPATLGLPLGAPGVSLGGGAVPQNWRFAYPMPTGCCRLRGVYPFSLRLDADAKADAAATQPQSHWNDNAFRVWHRNPDTNRQVRYVRELDNNLGSIILCDEPKPIAEFVSALVDLTQADPDVVRAIHYLVASYLAGALRKDPAVAASMLALHKDALSTAVSNAKNEEKTDPAPLPLYMRARVVRGWRY